MTAAPYRSLLVAFCAALTLTGCASLSRFFNAGEEKPAEVASPVADAASAPRMVVAYDLEIDAPSDLRKLLLAQLDLARFQRTDEADRLSAVELDRLSTTTPAQARALLETEGYFNSQVVLSRKPGTPEVVHVNVQPGPRTRISTVELKFKEGQVLPSEAEQAALRRAWTLPAGSPFSQSRWAAAKTALLLRARADGYPLAQWTDTSARVEAQRNEASIELTLDSGPQFHLGELRIEGLHYQDQQSVRRLAGFEPGAPYSEKTLQAFQERLIKTQLFDSVTVEIQPDLAQAQNAPVIVRLKEAPRQQATTGVGYDANTGQRVTLEYLNRVPFGLPVRASTKFDIGRDLRSATVELSSHPQPDMQRNLASLSYEEDLSGDQAVTSLSARLGRLRETGQDERLIYTELLRARELAPELVGSPIISSNAISLNTQWTQRRLDSLLLPTEGYQGLLLLGGGRAQNSIADAGEFGKLQFKLLGYRPLGSSWYGNARLELGQVFASDKTGIPEKLLFLAGGDDSVRGYAYQTLGPLVNGAVVGGRVLGTSSVEVAHPLLRDMPSLWGAIFVDAGNASDKWSDFHPVLGYGVGLRWRSPVGPLRVDLARGQETGRIRFSFSVGIAL